MIIESFQNDKVKYVSRLLADNRFRKKEGVFAVEGKQENSRARQFGFDCLETVISEKIFNETLPAGKIINVSDAVYSKLAYRGTSEGIIGIYKTKRSNLQDFVPSGSSSVIAVESIEKPGNLGAVLRSCEAFGIDALIVTDPKVDFYNPNVIRSSVGCLFGMNLFYADNEELYSFLLDKEYEICPTIMHQDAKNIQDRDLRKNTALIFGTEHSGLSDFWVGKGKNTIVPMVGSIDSLNLSNAVAICAFEILRQKMK